MRRLAHLAWPTGKLNLGVMAAAFIIFGLSLTFQSHRWESTPAYHVLLQVFTARAWGVVFLLAGLGMAAAAWRFDRRWAVTAALTAAFTLTTGWMLAFVVRYLTSGDTTPETWVSWAVFDFLLLNVAIGIDRPAPPPDAGIDDFRQAVDDAVTAAAENQKTVLLRALDSGTERLHDAISGACADWARALHAIVPAGAMPPGDLARQAIAEARNALLRAEEAYARATGQTPPYTEEAAVPPPRDSP
jgi:hypothetical protein